MIWWVATMNAVTLMLLVASNYRLHRRVLVLERDKVLDRAE